MDDEYITEDVIKIEDIDYESIKNARDVIDRIKKEINLNGYCRLDKFNYIVKGEIDFNSLHKKYALYGLKNFRLVKRKEKYCITVPYAVKFEY